MRYGHSTIIGCAAIAMMATILGACGSSSTSTSAKPSRGFTGTARQQTTIGKVGGTGACAQAAFADANYVVPPRGGTITSFSFLSTPVNKDQRLDFLALRPTGASKYIVIGKTSLITLAGTGLEMFPANFAVRGGDLLGMWVPRQAGVSPNLQNCAHFSNTDTVLQNFDQTADPGVGYQMLLPNTVRADLNESANL